MLRKLIHDLKRRATAARGQRGIALYLPPAQLAVIVREITDLADHVSLSCVCECLWKFYNDTDFFRKACLSLGCALHKANRFDPKPYAAYRTLACGVARTSFVHRRKSPCKRLNQHAMKPAMLQLTHFLNRWQCRWHGANGFCTASCQSRVVRSRLKKRSVFGNSEVPRTRRSESSCYSQNGLDWANDATAPKSPVNRTNRNRRMDG